MIVVSLMFNRIKDIMIKFCTFSVCECATVGIAVAVDVDVDPDVNAEVDVNAELDETFVIAVPTIDLIYYYE